MPVNGYSSARAAHSCSWHRFQCWKPVLLGKDVSLRLSMLRQRQLMPDASHSLCVFVVGCDRMVVGATMAALSNQAELLGAMHMLGSTLMMMRRGMSLWASPRLKVYCVVCCLNTKPMSTFFLGLSLYTEDFSFPYTLRLKVVLVSNARWATKTVWLKLNRLAAVSVSRLCPLMDMGS